MILEEDPAEVSNRELGAFWGGIFGAGYIHDFFGVEANGGIFDAGDIPSEKTISLNQIKSQNHEKVIIRNTFKCSSTENNCAA